MHFTHIQETLKGYPPKDVYSYAPPSGKMELRKEWKRKLLKENPFLHSKGIGLPIITILGKTTFS